MERKGNERRDSRRVPSVGGEVIEGVLVSKKGSKGTKFIEVDVPGGCESRVDSFRKDGRPELKRVVTAGNSSNSILNRKGVCDGYFAPFASNEKLHTILSTLVVAWLA